MKIQKESNNPGKGMRLSSKLLLLVLAFFLVMEGYYAFRLFVKKMPAGAESPEKVLAALTTGEVPLAEESGNSEEGNANVPNEKLIRVSSVTARWSPGTRVKDTEEALETLTEIAASAGIDMDQYQYVCTGHERNLHTETYTFQQEISGIPVWGYELTMAVNPNKTVRSIVGRQALVPDKAIADEGISEKEAEEKAESYIRASGLPGDDLKAMGKGILALPKGDTEAFQTFYRYTQIHKGQGMTLLVDTETGKVTEYASREDHVMEKIQLTGQEGTKELAADRVDSGKILLQDTNRNLAIYEEEDSGEPVAVNPLRRRDASDPVKQKAVDSLYWLQRAWQFYKDTQKRIGYNNSRDEIPLYLSRDSGQEDRGPALRWDGMTMPVILFPAGQAGIPEVRLDVLGHEYTHGLIHTAWNQRNDLAYSKENQALAEGFADIFGELIEDYYNGGRFDNTCDWKVGDPDKPLRDLKKAEEGQVKNLEAFRKKPQPVQGGWLMGHAAWLMNRGTDGKKEKRLSTESISRIFYNAMWMMNGRSDFEDLRFCLEATANVYAKTGKLTRDQLSGVMEALDAVGIPAPYDYSLASESRIHLEDSLGQPFTGAVISVADGFDPSLSAMKDQEVDEKGDASLSLDPGFYLIRISDRDGRLMKEASLIVNSRTSGNDAGTDSKDNGNLYSELVKISLDEMNPQGTVSVMIDGASDVRVLYKGDLLALSEDSGKVTTSYGQAENREGKFCLLLKKGPAYEVAMKGKDSNPDQALLNISVSGVGDSGRQAAKEPAEFRNIRAGKGRAVLQLPAEGSGKEKMTCLADPGGNGQMRDRYILENGGKAKAVPSPETLFMRTAAGGLILLFLLLQILDRIRKGVRSKMDRKAGPVCEHCGKVNEKGARACRNCGKLLPAPVTGHTSSFNRGREADSGLIPRFVLMILLLILVGISTWIYRQPGAQARCQRKENHPVTAACIYERGVKGKALQEKLMGK